MTPARQRLWTGRLSRPNWMRCGFGKKPTPEKATPLQPPGAAPHDRSRCRDDPHWQSGAGHTIGHLRGTPDAHRLLLHVALRHSAPEQCEGAPGLHRRSASCPICTPATSPTPRFARDHTKKARDTATSWDGSSPGTRPCPPSTPFWSDAA